MRLRIILAFLITLIYYIQDFRVYEGTREQPMPGTFPAPPIFEGKSPGDEVAFTNTQFRDFRPLVNAANQALS